MFHFIRQISYISTIHIIFNFSYFYFYLLLWFLFRSYWSFWIPIFDHVLFYYLILQFKISYHLYNPYSSIEKIWIKSFFKVPVVLQRCDSTQIYIVPSKRKFPIELENAIMYRALLNKYSMNSDLNTTTISHNNLIWKHAEHYNHCISTLLGCIHNKPLSFSHI